MRSLQSFDGHRRDVAKDDSLMACDLLGLGEIWLEKGKTVDFEGFTGYFAAAGEGGARINVSWCLGGAHSRWNKYG